MKKGQMEIMGLVIVVILITIGMLFAIRFVVLKQPEDYKKQFTQSELASNMLSTLLKTSAPHTGGDACHGLSFTELYQDCARLGSITCDNGPSNGPGQNSCDYVAAATKEIFANTFDAWGITYKFVARTEFGPLEHNNGTNPGAEFIFPNGEKCRGAKKHKSYPIPIDATGTQILTLTLDICDK